MKCETCGARLHVYQSPDPNEATFVCNVCGNSFSAGAKEIGEREQDSKGKQLKCPVNEENCRILRASIAAQERIKKIEELFLPIPDKFTFEFDENLKCKPLKLSKVRVMEVVNDLNQLKKHNMKMAYEREEEAERHEKLITKFAEALGVMTMKVRDKDYIIIVNAKELKEKLDPVRQEIEIYNKQKRGEENEADQEASGYVDYRSALNLEP